MSISPFLKSQLESMQVAHGFDSSHANVIRQVMSLYEQDKLMGAEQPVDSATSPMELLKLLGYINSMIGYCHSLRVGTVITEDYMKRMESHYIPNVQQACLLIADLLDKAQAPKRESSGLKIGEFSIFRRGDKIAIHCDDGEGGDFPEKEVEQAIRMYYAGAF